MELSSHDVEFKNQGELSAWLITERGVVEAYATAAAPILFKNDFRLASTLTEISSDNLILSGLNIPTAQHLSNKLKEQEQPNPNNVAPHDEKTIIISTVRLQYGDKKERHMNLSKDDQTIDRLTEFAHEQFAIEEAKLGFFLVSEKPKKRIYSDEQVASLVDGSIVQVVNEQKGFSDVKKVENALSLFGFDQTQLEVDHEVFASFQAENLVLDAKDKHVAHATSTISSLLQLVDLVGGCEATQRMYIAPILHAAGRLVNHVKLKVEHRVSSPEARGPIDYLFFYKVLCVCVAEGKKNDIDVGIAQNIAQLGAVQGNRKRKADEMSRTACYGIATTFLSWVFIKVEDNKAVRSPLYVVEPENEESIKNMIARVTLLLTLAKDNVDEAQGKKKQQKSA